MLLSATYTGHILKFVNLQYLTESKKDHTSSKQRRDENRYQFDDMFNRKFYADMPDETWISGKQQLRCNRLHTFIAPLPSGDHYSKFGQLPITHSLLNKNISFNVFTDDTVLRVDSSSVLEYNVKLDKSIVLFSLKALVNMITIHCLN